MNKVKTVIIEEFVNVDKTFQNIKNIKVGSMTLNDLFGDNLKVIEKALEERKELLKWKDSQQDLIKGKDEYIAKLCNDRAELKEQKRIEKVTKPYVVDIEWFFKRIHCRCPEYGTIGFKEFFFLGKDHDDILDSVQLYDKESKDGRFYYVDKERYDKIKKYLKPLTKKVYSPKDDCEIEIEIDDNGNPLLQKESEPTIQFDKKVLESGLSFKEAYMRMVEGKKISRPCFKGYWFMDHESRIVIHTRYAEEIKAGDITNIVINTLANDWEVIE